MTSRVRTILIAAVALAAVGELAVVATPAPAAGLSRAALDAPSTRPSRWVTIWRDDFTGRAGARPDPGRWQVDGDGHHENGDLEVYRDDPANAGLDGHGHLRITATMDSEGNYWSARLISVPHDLLPPEGGSLRIEARVRPASGAGVGTSIWTWGNDVDKWPANGEIDVAEQLGAQPDQVHYAIQCPTCHETAPPFGLGGIYTDPGQRAYGDGFHTFAAQWNRDPDSISWYVDGRLIDTVTPADTGTDGWVFDQPMFLLLSVRIGGRFVGDVGPTTLPATALVDDVRILRTDGA
ncbi:glycoside hydrolase family 16 protein [Rugosimonospora africana]|uniref:GH16 domain-containing protein n=1 Tax=Rugosimonospora africana TaxID=556532 RepID=A0A8J3VNQ9_9ACTN|nr:glycoside hydrolase family 16 protein [Rugosimonospora africana]GIH13449.1 hypothetical protein Raf01_16210 [Rugosimonospora africana]